MDYCLLSHHGCEYSCVNTDRSFVCECPEGHVLRADGKTCARECGDVGRGGPGTGGRGRGAPRTVTTGGPAPPGFVGESVRRPLPAISAPVAAASLSQDGRLLPLPVWPAVISEPLGVIVK